MSNFVPPIGKGDTPVFDDSKFGVRVRVERWDEPGAEFRFLGEGSRAEGNAATTAANILSGDNSGDWSWKKHRPFPKYTYKGEPRNVRDIGYVEETEEDTLARISHQAAARAAHFQAKDYQGATRHG